MQCCGLRHTSNPIPGAATATADASVGERWRQWGEPAVAGPVITALVISLVSIGAVGFQALKVDIRSIETRIITIEATLRDEFREQIRASEARQQEETMALRADVRGLSGKLDRVLESLLAARWAACAKARSNQDAPNGQVSIPTGRLLMARPCCWRLWRRQKIC